MGTRDMSTVLATHDLVIGHGKKPLVGPITLELNTGELVALIGINGGGKSTLLHTLAGLLPALSGSVSLNGDALSDLSATQRARRMALVLTGRPQAGPLDVRTVVALGRHPWTGHFGKLGPTDLKLLQDAMEATGTADFASRSLHQLSDGEAQRVMIARALAQDTDILFLDEPTAYLDLVNRVQMLRLLGELAHARNKAILLSTHDLHTALDLCDKVLLINGDSLWCGSTAEARHSGVLEQVFIGQDLTFDPQTGSFRTRGK